MLTRLSCERANGVPLKTRRTSTVFCEKTRGISNFLRCLAVATAKKVRFKVALGTVAYCFASLACLVLSSGFPRPPYLDWVSMLLKRDALGVGEWGKGNEYCLTCGGKGECKSDE